MIQFIKEQTIPQCDATARPRPMASPNEQWTPLLGQTGRTHQGRAQGRPSAPVMSLWAPSYLAKKSRVSLGLFSGHILLGVS